METQFRSKAPYHDPEYADSREQSTRSPTIRSSVWASYEVSRYERNLSSRKHRQEQITTWEKQLDALGTSANPHFTSSPELLKTERDWLEASISLYKAQEIADAENGERPLKEKFIEALKELHSAYSENPKAPQARFAQDELETMFLDEDWQEELRLYFGNELEGFSLGKIYVKLSKDELPEEFLYRVAKRHGQLMEERDRRRLDPAKLPHGESRGQAEGGSRGLE